MTHQVAERLGIKGKVRTPLDYIAISEKGLPGETVMRLMNILAVTLVEMAPILVVSRKTIERYRHAPGKSLNPSVSERVLRIGLVVQRCEEVFGEAKNCNEWLKTANTALGGRTPLSLLRSDFGIDMVLNELGRIEHGIIS